MRLLTPKNTRGMGGPRVDAVELVAHLVDEAAHCQEGAHVDDLGHDIRQLVLGADEDNLSPAMLDQPMEIVLPKQEVGRLGCGRRTCWRDHRWLRQR